MTSKAASDAERDGVMEQLDANMGPAGKFLGWRMVGIASFSQNIAIGLTFGSFSTLVLAIQERFSTTRTLAALGISFTILTLSLGAPMISVLLRRFTLRAIMTTGALLGATGYFLQAFTTSISAYLLVAALMISPGVLLLGIIPSSILATNWFSKGQGRAMGLVTMPALIMVTPLVTSWVLTNFGFSAVMNMLGFGYLLVIPALLYIVDRPEKVGQKPYGYSAENQPHAPPARLDFGHFLKRPLMWVIVLGCGIAVGGSALRSTHFVPILAGQGWPISSAAFLQSLAGGTGILGALGMGYLADRFGPGIALAVNCLLQAILWVCFIQQVPYIVLVAAAGVVGACAGGFSAGQAVLLRRSFGLENFPQAIGVLGLLTLPFTVGSGPLTSLVYDATGSYVLPLVLQMVAYLASMAIFLGLGRYLARR